MWRARRLWKRLEEAQELVPGAFQGEFYQAPEMFGGGKGTKVPWFFFLVCELMSRAGCSEQEAWAASPGWAFWIGMGIREAKVADGTAVMSAAEFGAAKRAGIV